MTGKGRGAMTGERPRVIVVGGGLAGMAAALACTDGGAEVTLLEGRKWLGGATASFDRDGLRIDTGQHVFLRCCTSYRAFLGRLGVTGKTELQRRMDIPVLSPRRGLTRLRRGGVLAPLHLAPAPALNLPASEASLALAAKVFRTGLLERADAADIGVPLVPLAELHGEPATAALAAAGAEVHLGARVRTIEVGADGVVGARLDDL